MIKDTGYRDEFLQWLHILAFMDDTVLLATSRRDMVRKLEALKTYCCDYGMKINQDKTKFLVINGSVGDDDPIHVDGFVVNHCTSYVYLGSPFTSDGSPSAAVKMHAKTKMCQVLKYVSFVKKNNDVPFIVKRRVLDAALMSSLLYGCESWFEADLKPITKLYNWAIKQLLGVRRSTSSLVCYAEAGYPLLTDLVRQKQHKFFVKMWKEGSNLDDDPLIFAIKTVRNINTSTGKYINDLLNSEVPADETLLEKVRAQIRANNNSRCIVYKEINPDLVVHSLYKQKHVINEFHRVCFTRFRVSGHNLAVETGRWNRRGRGRLPLEERICYLWTDSDRKTCCTGMQVNTKYQRDF